MKHVLRLGILLAALALAMPAAAGDWAHDREGFVIGFNIGGGTATASPDVGEDDSGGGGAGSFRLGWAFNNSFMLGLESTAWVGNTDVDADLTLSSAKLNLTWYPSAKGWFVRGGFGSGRAELNLKFFNPDVTIEDSGPSFGLGAGHEWRLTEKFSLGGAVDFDAVGLNYGDFSFTNFTVQFNWYL